MNSSELLMIMDDFPINEFRKILLDWWSHNYRVFPWRDTNDPYKIIIAEILLHRTNAKQVIHTYKFFLEKYPNIQSAALSSTEEFEKISYSLGLRWRWNLFYLMIREIVDRFGSKIPENFEDLISLSGVSHYIGSAVRCFAFGYPEALLDTNTVRVSGRLLGIKITDSSRRSEQFRYILQTLIDPTQPREFNWALIDFAALMCKSRNPNHSDCPLIKYCKYYILQS
jgi:A/G-specific adenine glycosylase